MIIEEVLMIIEALLRKNVNIKLWEGCDDDNAKAYDDNDNDNNDDDGDDGDDDDDANDYNNDDDNLLQTRDGHGKSILMLSSENHNKCYFVVFGIKPNYRCGKYKWNDVGLK